jgi:hypothetical protein
MSVEQKAQKSIIAQPSVIDCGWQTMVKSQKYANLSCHVCHKTPWRHRPLQIQPL